MHRCSKNLKIGTLFVKLFLLMKDIICIKWASVLQNITLCLYLAPTYSQHMVLKLQKPLNSVLKDLELNFKYSQYRGLLYSLRTQSSISKNLPCLIAKGTTFHCSYCTTTSKCIYLTVNPFRLSELDVMPQNQVAE